MNPPIGQASTRSSAASSAQPRAVVKVWEEPDQDTLTLSVEKVNSVARDQIEAEVTPVAPPSHSIDINGHKHSIVWFKEGQIVHPENEEQLNDLLAQELTKAHGDKMPDRVIYNAGAHELFSPKEPRGHTTIQLGQDVQLISKLAQSGIQKAPICRCDPMDSYKNPSRAPANDRTPSDDGSDSGSDSGSSVSRSSTSLRHKKQSSKKDLEGLGDLEIDAIEDFDSNNALEINSLDQYLQYLQEVEKQSIGYSIIDDQQGQGKAADKKEPIQQQFQRAIGEASNAFSKSKGSVKDYYAIIIRKHGHYTLLLFDRKAQTYEWFDSFGNSIDQEIADDLQLDQSGQIPSGLSPQINDKPATWKPAIQQPAFKLQNDGNNCGAWVLYYIEHRCKDKRDDQQHFGDLQGKQAEERAQDAREFRHQAALKIEHKATLPLEEKARTKTIQAAKNKVANWKCDSKANSDLK